MSWGLGQWGLDPWGGITDFPRPEIAVEVIEAVDVKNTIIVSITVQYTRRLLEDSIYQVKAEVLEAKNIGKELFVYERDPVCFSHHAMVCDLDTYGTKDDTGFRSDFLFYRDICAQKNFPTLEQALHFQTVTTQRFRILALAWKPIVVNFIDTKIAS